VWFAGLRSRVHCLDWTLDAAIVWGGVINDVQRAGFTVGIKDTMIAASAKHHGLTVATRNVADFARGAHFARDGAGQSRLEYDKFKVLTGGDPGPVDADFRSGHEGFEEAAEAEETQAPEAMSLNEFFVEDAVLYDGYV
jgi:hypothetical protein